MQLILDEKKLTAAVTDHWLVAMALTVFGDFVQATSAEEFARRFGTVGTEVLSRYYVKGDK